ncbi:Apc15p protein-domain-containing protein [Pseudomassariella vexata]|uniref:Apc15p protein-domain-containing protein n=1 Tax=Pseudomassariella vexata TaxID=1141098 RepID=A0A1Y2DZL0_9PEZI|nr:Apc15p protein-domain-containing protein [Pseudomassariella vexata]ORY64065.1 Apc15p protein-domain-containing protein [Pseudomassariella vexata]
MLSILPDLAPRDSHALWYTSSRNPLSSYTAQRDNSDSQHNPNQRRNQQLVDRSPLARLRADELKIERRLHNVSNFGSQWLKPPGIPKTLNQLREEQKEQQEHQEALRREQLAQELADAEAAGAGGIDAALDGQLQVEGGEDGMDDVQLDGARDLDDDIPEGDSADFGLSVDEDDDEEDEDDDDDGEEDEEQRAARAQQQLMAQRMQQVDDPFRENASHSGNGVAFYGGEDEVDDEDQAHMIEEEDLVGDDGVEMDMDADLDEDIPEAGSAVGYEHTDTEADLSSDDDEAEMSFVARAPQTVRFRGSLARTDATRHSLVISDILSRDGSSILDSSPQAPRQGHSRHSQGRAG